MPTPRGRFDVAVTGLGLVTAAGVGTEETWRTVLAGMSTASTDPELDGVPVDFSYRVPGFDGDRLLGRRLAFRLDRHVQFGLAAAREAVADSALDTSAWEPARVGVVMGTALGGMIAWERESRRILEHGPANVSPRLIPQAAVNMVAGEIAIDLGAAGPNLVTSTACASGATALGTARELLRSGVCDVVLAGGAEASVCPLVVAPFARMGALSVRRDDPAAASRPFDADRDGFVIGEGAAVLVLERTAHAEARGARVYARLSGYGASADGTHPNLPDPDGLGVERAVTAALRDAALSPADVDHVNAHGTATPLNDEVEARTMRRLLGERPLLTSTKGVTGHALGAAGAIEAAVTALTLAHGSVPPTANLASLDPAVEMDVVAKAARNLSVEVALSNSFGFGGQNAVLVMTRA
ncbi:beta-ketoacyl-[acyl-carrier-protein] synthase family protein [Streptomyces sp. NPDC007901]|uniref:beta-ketoacyl-[acyl-carrier-protein] synthase family protein n=1 Tax=Streptomyces sp. NPDC007901 TaxID=3364785 RepID=UPI0036DFD29F